jgi:DNA-directed RNA polymerase subunit RPC12/RpoP
MATLHCRHCGGDIESDARRTQCRQCGELFPFGCEVCQRNLRSPFPVYDDERYLTLNVADPRPLCADHFLRKCPDCSKWFQADENPGFFRCIDCAETAQMKQVVPEWDDGGRFEMEPPMEEREVAHAAPSMVRRRPDPNMMVMAGAGCALLALVGWYLLAH